jgi:hypothetical protein
MFIIISITESPRKVKSFSVFYYAAGGEAPLLLLPQALINCALKGKRRGRHAGIDKMLKKE